ncbi:MAG: hypothetical protein ACYC4U_03560 [Pirellulaceae bacterium]
MAFNPYYEWLGIPPDEQPADYYRLLGLRRFESNLNVIENAAERQQLLLKTLQNGPHSELTQQLMNEVSTARICLLDRQRKSEYDAKLQERVGDKTVASESQRPVFPPPLEVIPELEQPWSEDLLQPRLRPPSASKTPHRFRSGAFGRSVNLAPISNRMPLLIGGFAMIGAIVITCWLFVNNGSSRPTKEAVNQERGADSSIISNLGQEGQASATGSLRAARTTRPPPPPVPIIVLKDPRESESGQMKGTSSNPDQNGIASDGQASLTRGTGVNDGPEVEATDRVDRVDYQVTEHSSFTLESEADPADQAAAYEGTTQRRPLLNSQDERVVPQRGAEGGAGSQRPAGGRSVDNRNSRPVQRPPESDGMSTTFDRLPHEFDLSGAIAAAGSESILLGELLSFEGSSWRVLLEDYASTAGESRFFIGPVSTDGNVLRWPFFRLTDANASLPPIGLTAEETPGQTLLGHVEASPSGLLLRFSRSASPELIEQFTCCTLTVQNDSGQHHIQMQASERIPPLAVALDDSKKAVTLNALPATSMLSPDRIALEILRVELGGVEMPATDGLRASVNKELTVTLNSELRCELAIKLSERDGQFTVVVMPRYMVNDRRQQLVLAEIEKDLARSNSQLARNQQDLIEAQNRLVLLVREMKRVGKSSPRNPQEEAALQVRVGQLENMRASAQSKVHRLSEVCPKLAKNRIQMEQVLSFVKTMASDLVLHCRVIAQGETGDLILCQTTAHR